MAKIFERQKIILLEISATGPRKHLQAQAEQAVDLARDNAREILSKYRGDVEDVVSSINYTIERGPEGLVAFIGIRDRGEIERYLSNKENKERVWLTPAIERVFD